MVYTIRRNTGKTKITGTSKRDLVFKYSSQIIIPCCILLFPLLPYYIPLFQVPLPPCYILPFLVPSLPYYILPFLVPSLPCYILLFPAPSLPYYILPFLVPSLPCYILPFPALSVLHVGHSRWRLQRLGRR
ncbi:hypothetical protein BDR03DRAFT_937677 [Suillus americanus]|nr:hypothetical protein BDR03DRAFT_937677 [Suillus americanus]